MMQGRKGLTLAELVVVVAIIGLLAAMLLPVLAQARASALARSCMSNLMAIAAATRMYSLEWDRYWPSEQDPRVTAYFDSAPGGPGGGSLQWCGRATQANPYLREPVLLSRYVRSRDIWKCPSARIQSAARFIVPPGPHGDWLQAYMDHEGEWGQSGDFAIGPCYLAFPSRWGGRVTDSFLQGMSTAQPYARPADRGVFVSGYGVNTALRDLSPAQIAHPSRYIVVADDGRQVEFWSANGIAYPDLCRIEACGLWSGTAGCCNADWTSCPWSRNCGLDWSLCGLFFSSATYRRQFTRHGSGSFLAFADGHVGFVTSENIITNTPPQGNLLEGTCSCWP